MDRQINTICLKTHSLTFSSMREFTQKFAANANVHESWRHFVNIFSRRTYYGRAYATVLRLSSVVCDVMYCG